MIAKSHCSTAVKQAFFTVLMIVLMIKIIINITYIAHILSIVFTIIIIIINTSQSIASSLAGIEFGNKHFVFEPRVHQVLNHSATRQF